MKSYYKKIVYLKKLEMEIDTNTRITSSITRTNSIKSNQSDDKNDFRSDDKNNSPSEIKKSNSQNNISQIKNKKTKKHDTQ